MKVTAYESVLKDKQYFVESILECNNEYHENKVVNIFDDVEYQEILGFGAAFTESAAYNYSLLSEDDKKDFLQKYFDKKQGIGYNFGRTHINSCDFSLDIYSYVENNDETLETFNIERDKKYIIPFLKDAMDYCEEEIVLFSSPWSPPGYMKENESPVKGGILKEEYKKIWALYYAKYIKAYLEEGIKITAITVQNEPLAIQTWESCYYSAEDERDFIEKYLIPVLDAEGLSDIRIIIWDHNKERVYDRSKTILSAPAVRERVWAVGHHWYSGDHYNGPSLVYEQFQKPSICTEFCGGIDANAETLAEYYAREMCENFNNYMIASCDWNILLSSEGGPYHNRTADSVSVAGKVFESKDGGCHAPVLYDKEEHKLIYTPIYYYIGHFSRFVQRGAKRVATTKYTGAIYTCAFKNPDHSLVAVILNSSDKDLQIKLRRNEKITPLFMKAHSIITVIFSE